MRYVHNVLRIGKNISINKLLQCLDYNWNIRYGSVALVYSWFDRLVILCYNKESLNDQINMVQ